MVVPIAEDTVNDGAQIQLGTERVKHHAAVNAWHGESGLVHLKRMCTFRGLHGQMNNQVELDGDLVYLNRLEGPWDKHEVCRCGSFFLVDIGTTEGNSGICKGDRGQPGMQTFGCTRRNRATTTAR